jgi:2-methylcitrate dehydratase PrpD
MSTSTPQTKPAVTQLGEMMAATRYEDLPAAVQQSAKMRILNTAAAAVAGRMTPASRLALSFAKKRQSAGPATYWLGAGRGSIEDVVFTNGITAHSALLNDMMGGHMGPAVPPTALAVGEAEGSHGSDILTSIVLGYEIAARIDASGYLTSANTKRGVRLSSATWNLGPAATASYLMKLPASGMADALAVTVGALCAPGTYEVIGRHGTSERFVQLGAGVREGVFAAELARAGFTGTDTALEGPSGFYFVWTGKADAPAELLAELGTKWHITDAILKPYGAGATNNFVIYAAEQMIKRTPIRYEDIADIVVRTTDWKHMAGVIDAGPFDDFEQAHVSCPFAVAVMLVFGSYDVSAILKGIGDARVNDLAQRIKMTVGEPGAAHHQGGNRLTSKYGELTVTLRDGRVLDSNALAMPDSMIKPNWEQMVERFHHLTAEALSAETREAFVAAVSGLDEASDCSALVELLGRAV